jgi:hypothetical protein
LTSVHSYFRYDSGTKQIGARCIIGGCIETSFNFELKFFVSYELDTLWCIPCTQQPLCSLFFFWYKLSVCLFFCLLVCIFVYLLFTYFASEYEGRFFFAILRTYLGVKKLNSSASPTKPGQLTLLFNQQNV